VAEKSRSAYHHLDAEDGLYYGLEQTGAIRSVRERSPGRSHPTAGNHPRANPQTVHSTLLARCCRHNGIT
jgi:hypothetical protein